MPDNYSQQIDVLFQRLKNNFSPNPTLMEKIAGYLKDNIRENLNSGGIGAPIQWAALSPKYAKQKAKLGMVQKILTATGAMEQSFYQRTTNNNAIIGTDAPQAALLNYGGTVTRVSKSRRSALTVTGKTKAKNFIPKQYTAYYPPRPFMYLTDYYREMIMSEIKNFARRET